MEERTLNAEISAYSKYGSGADQGVGFKGVDGFWTLAPALKISLADYWPPAKGKTIKVHLRIKPKTSGNGFYHDIMQVGEADGPAEGWETGEPPRDKARPSSVRSDDTNLSIQRQVVVKAEAEVLAVLLAHNGELDPEWESSALYAQWRAHCAELWGTPETVTPPSQKPSTGAQNEAVVDLFNGEVVPGTPPAEKIDPETAMSDAGGDLIEQIRELQRNGGFGAKDVIAMQKEMVAAGDNLSALADVYSKWDAKKAEIF